MPTYTIQQDPPPAPERVSTASTTFSMFSGDHAGEVPGSHADGVPTLNYKPSYHPSYHAHPRQQVNDYGPQVRQSRLPIFKQVRTMLQKPPAITTPGNPKWDEYTGELSDNGKPARVKPSTYVSPYEGAFQANRRRSPDRSSRSRRNMSPVSVLRDDEMMSASPVQASHHSLDEWSPVSPVSPISPVDHEERYGDQYLIPEMMPEPLSPNVQRTPQQQQTPSSGKHITRKPVSRNVSTSENFPPVSPQHSPSQSSDMGERMIDDKDAGPQSTSHFSWTTYAPSVAPGRQSLDTLVTRQTGLAPAHESKQSHFSWSTVNTNATYKPRAQSPPPPPLPEKYSAPVEKYSGPPVQSILSRGRPAQRIEQKDMWVPPPRVSSALYTTTPLKTTCADNRPLPLPKDKTPAKSKSPSTPASHESGSGKALPPPPTVANLTHLETLVAQERSLALQRMNVEKGVRDLEKIEKASPLDVPFATVRDAKKRLGEYRARLADVKLEEREVGIAIARARRREEQENGGEGESLWVRRVTG